MLPPSKEPAPLRKIRSSVVTKTTSTPATQSQVPPSNPLPSVSHPLMSARRSSVKASAVRPLLGCGRNTSPFDEMMTASTQHTAMTSQGRDSTHTGHGVGPRPSLLPVPPQSAGSSSPYLETVGEVEMASPLHMSALKIQEGFLAIGCLQLNFPNTTKAP